MAPPQDPPQAPSESASKSPAAEGTPQKDAEELESNGEVSSDEGEASDPGSDAQGAGQQADAQDPAPPLPNEPAPDGPPLPQEPLPAPVDDGWDCQWEPNAQAWFFYNRFTGKSQWDNPRVQGEAAVNASAAQAAPQPPVNEAPAAGGYNPAIHGDYDPNAWYAKGTVEDDPEDTAAGAAAVDPSNPYAATVAFNRFTGQFQAADVNPENHNDEAKSRRQMNAFFDVDAAANSHDGRSLKAERSNKKPSKSELKAFKEKRRARKEEKRRAWLRD